VAWRLGFGCGDLSSREWQGVVWVNFCGLKNGRDGGCWVARKRG
jgi:hypothetical protein